MLGFYFIIICSLLTVSCNYNVQKNPANNNQTGNGNSLLKADAVINWDLMQNSILNQCMSCHIGKSSPELGSYAAVVQNKNKIAIAVNNNSMPPAKNGYQPFDDCRKAILNSWVQAGSPETMTAHVSDFPDCKNITDNPGSSNIPLAQAPLNYDTVLKRILQPKCINCHNPDSDDIDAAGILFYPYSEIVNRVRLWQAPAISSKIIKVLTRNDEDRMPPPPKDEPLSKDEIDFIKRWVDAGVPQ